MASPLKTGRVWITRTLPEAEMTAQRVRDLGGLAIIEPVLEAIRLKVEWPEVLPDALVISSAHALEAMIADSPFERLSRLPLFVVGEALKAKCLEAGFSGPVNAAAESKALVTVIGDHMPLASHILYLAPRDPATPLAEALSDKGYKTETLTVYETVPVMPDFTKIFTGTPLFVLVHSPRAGFHLGQLLNKAAYQHPDEMALDVLTFICISEAAQNGLLAGLDLPARSGVRCLIAERPDEASLIARLKDALKAID